MVFDTIEKFLTHTGRHRENVVELSSVVFNAMSESPYYRKEFNLENSEIERFKELVPSIMKKHDAAKMEDSPNFLHKFQLEEPLCVSLYEMAGKPLTDFGKKIVKRLNEADGLIMSTAFLQAKLSSNQIKMFKEIESICDLVERGFNPLSEYEFGRKMSKASVFMQKNGDEVNQHKLKLIQLAEDYYEKNIMSKQLSLGEELGLTAQESPEEKLLEDLKRETSAPILSKRKKSKNNIKLKGQ